MKYFSPVGVRFREFAQSYSAQHLDRLDALAERSGTGRERRRRLGS